MSLSNLENLKRFKKHYDRGHVLFREGEESFDLYILLEGEVTVYKSDIKIAVIKMPGSFIGEINALLEDSRTATCSCTSSAKILCIPSNSVEAFFSLTPSFGYKLAKDLALKLKRASLKIIDNQI
jgi:CRP-like cAMP-binding protein